MLFNKIFKCKYNRFYCTFFPLHYHLFITHLNNNAIHFIYTVIALLICCLKKPMISFCGIVILITLIYAHRYTNKAGYVYLNIHIYKHKSFFSPLRFSPFLFLSKGINIKKGGFNKLRKYSLFLRLK